MEQTPESYTGIYGMHKYWSKKPFNLVRELIQKNTKKDDIVLDPFCGSGISIIQSVLSGRKAIGVDLNPAAIFITQQTLLQVDPKQIQGEYDKIKTDIENKINDLYAVKRNSQLFTGTHFIWKNNVLAEIWYKEKNNKIITKPTKNDIDSANSISYDDIKLFYPTENLIQNSRINAKAGMRVNDLFTPRNLFALSILYDRIEKIEDNKLRNIFKFCFTATLGQASRMVFVIHGRKKPKVDDMERKEIGSWVIGYWIPNENFEINVWNCFTNRYNRIYKAKSEQWDYDYKLKTCTSFSKLDGSNLFLVNGSAFDILKKLPPNSVDYIITDPPHGDRLPYLELSLMWNSWLKLKTDYAKELVISDAKERDKTIANYDELFSKIAIEMARVLKPKKTLSLMFNSLDDETWKKLLVSMNNAGLTLQNTDTISYSATSVVQDNRRRGLKSDFVLNFIKLNKSATKHLEELTPQKELALVKTLVSQFHNQNEKPEVYKILNFVVSSLVDRGVLFSLSKILEQIDNHMSVKILKT